MIFYLAVWCETWKGMQKPWEDHVPQAIPAMMLAGIATFVLLTVAFWPVWGFLGIIIQFVFFMGYLNSGHFLPGGMCGSLLMFMIFFGAFFTSVMIPHEGLAHYKMAPTKGNTPRTPSLVGSSVGGGVLEGSSE